MKNIALKNHEKWSLLGLFLIMVSVFLPWYITRFDQVELPWDGTTYSGNIYGHLLFFGHVFILLASIYFVVILYTKRKRETSETFITKTFLTGMMAFIFIFNVLGVLFTTVGSIYFSPHLGILFLTVGLIMVVVGLKKNYNEINEN